MLNLILNAIFLMVFKWGVKGVAIATVISRIVNLAILIIVSGTKIKAKQNPERLRLREIFVQIIKIGIPSALETVLYNVAMTLVTKFLNQMDPDGLNTTARSYTSQITNFSYCIGAALAQANAIMTGWRIGEKIMTLVTDRRGKLQYSVLYAQYHLKQYLHWQVVRL